MKHIRGFTQSHWMPPLVECLPHIALAAGMVDDFLENAQNTDKTQLLASNYGTFPSLVIRENFAPQNEPSTHLTDGTSCIKMSDSTISAG
jgi:hypothetical protein